VDCNALHWTAVLDWCKSVSEYITSSVCVCHRL